MTHRRSILQWRKIRSRRARVGLIRTVDTFGYNDRSEVTAANVSGVPSTYGYDEIGNSTNWTANCLNQYTEFTHDADGNMTQCGDWTYTYDAANRLKTSSSNDVLLVTNFYDAKSRRVRKVTQDAATTFFYDNWNLIEERVAYTNGTSSTIRYYWGKDLSGTLQGAGGVGGLLYLAADGAVYVPFYDNNGNITRYLDASGNTVAQYTYDAFGNLIAKSGPLAGFFRHRFSTKYFDPEAGLYYYGYRFYHPTLMRWLNRDPIEEDGGLNLYACCDNNALSQIDAFGTTKVADVLGSFFALSSTGPTLWVMDENDPYTDIVRAWNPVKCQVAIIKARVASNSHNWSVAYTTSSTWKPQMKYGFDPRSGYECLVASPAGTDPKTARNAYIEYLLTSIQTDTLHTSAIGSFRIAATVDSISFKPCRATINIWMYNEMSRRSFGRFATDPMFRHRPMNSQFMWWNWKEYITFDEKGRFKDEPQNGNANAWF